MRIMSVEIVSVELVPREFVIGRRRQPGTCGKSFRSFPFHLLALLLMSTRPLCCFLKSRGTIHCATWLTESMSSAHQKLTVELHDYVNVMLKRVGARCRASIGEITAQVLLERAAIGALDGLPRRERFLGFAGELSQAFLVGRVQVEEISLVGR